MGCVQYVTHVCTPCAIQPQPSVYSKRLFEQQLGGGRRAQAHTRSVGFTN